MDPEGEPHWYPPLTAKVVNSCGAGDSFLAALAVADGKGIAMQDASSITKSRSETPTKRLGPPVGIPVLIRLKLAKFLMKGTDANGK